MIEPFKGCLSRDLNALPRLIKTAIAFHTFSLRDAIVLWVSLSHLILVNLKYTQIWIQMKQCIWSMLEKEISVDCIYLILCLIFTLLIKGHLYEWPFMEHSHLNGLGTELFLTFPPIWLIFSNEWVHRMFCRFHCYLGSIFSMVSWKRLDSIPHTLAECRLCLTLG